MSCLKVILLTVFCFLETREGMDEESREKFWRAVQCTVEKDVVRTDRSHVYFKGADNPNIEILKYGHYTF